MSISLSVKIINAFGATRLCCYYLDQIGDHDEAFYDLFPTELETAEKTVVALLENDSFEDQSVRDDVLRTLTKCASLMSTAEMPFLRREIEALIQEIEEQTSSGLERVA